MSKKISINWRKVTELGTRLDENINEFESARKKIQEIAISLDECWKGRDAENFRVSLFNYLESLKDDYNYLLQWESVFKRSAAKYSDGVEEGLRRVRSLEDELKIPGQMSQEKTGEMNFYE